MQVVALVVFCVIYLIITYLFKIIDEIVDILVNKTYSRKKGITNHNGKSIMFSILGMAPFEDISADFFDDIVVKWGVSRDFLLFKDAMGQSNNFEKKILKNWESIFNGEELDN